MRSSLLLRPSRCPAAIRSAGPSRARTSPVACYMAAGRGLSVGTKCPYRTLGLTPDESLDEDSIKVAFRQKAKQMHPDVSVSADAGLAFMECQHAYQTLLDPVKRAKYDKSLQPRANSQVFSYLNARSAARHGVPPSRVPSRSPYVDRSAIYSTMSDLLKQVKSCAKNLEREIHGKDGGRSRPASPSTASSFGGTLYGNANSSSASYAASSSSNASGGSPYASSASCVGGRRVVVETDCGEAECCEPWLYYAVQAAAEEERQQQQRGSVPARRRL